MKLGHHTHWLALGLLAFPLFSCGGSGSSGGGASFTIASQVQDLTLDPDGRTTVITFSALPAGLVPANFDSSGIQTATGITIVGSSVQVTWDTFLSPNDTVRVIGVPGVVSAFGAVTTTDASVPTFTITDGTQTPGLGADVIEVTFAGTRVDPVAAANVGTWALNVNGQAQDLTGSLFSFNAGTQVLTITTGPNANLHAAFTLAATSLDSVGGATLAVTPVVGAATGDLVAPTLVGVRQRLDLDEFGRTVEFEFSEPMDPDTAVLLPNFGVTLPDSVTGVTANLTGETLTATFNSPMVPGTDTITLTGLIDAHGNAFPNGPQAVAAFNPVASMFDGGQLPTATTVADEGGDVVVVKTTQAFDPDSAEDPLRWIFNYDGNNINLATQTLTYDLLNKELTIELDFDMKNTLPFSITGSGVVEVDGQAFNLGIASTVSGDTTDVTVMGIQQNRTLFPAGNVLDVTLSEDVEQVPAELVANWPLAGGPTVVNAELLMPGLNVVRLTLDMPATPVDVTATAQNLEDLAGNVMPAPQTMIALTSSDMTAPTPSAPIATAVEGALNDTIRVTFDDDMIASEVQLAANWTVESPIGTPFDTTGATIAYDGPSKTATLEFDNLLTTNFKNGDDFNVTFAGMRDLGGNTVAGTVLTGNIVSEMNLPEVHTIWRDGVTTDEVVVVFTEPCDLLDDLFAAGTNEDGTRFVLRDNIGAERAKAADAVILQNGLAVRIGFSTPVAVTDTIDVLGVTDMAGNPMFPAMDIATVAEDASIPSLNTGVSTFNAATGERNDTIVVSFDVPMNPWSLLEPQNYTFSPALNLDQASLAFDGTSTVTITLDGAAADDIQNATNYDLTVNDVFSAQGISRNVADTELGITASGDAVIPDLLAGNLRVDPLTADSLLFESTEALNFLSAIAFANYDHNGGNIAQQAELLTPRSIRITFGTGVDPMIGESTSFSYDDLAGNNSGVIMRTVTAADVAAPNVLSVSGMATEGVGGDFITVTWDESIDLVTGLDTANYSFTNNGNAVNLTGATVRYNSLDHSVTFYLLDGVELDPAFQVVSSISNVLDVSGNSVGGPITPSGAVGGDTTAPSVLMAFVNLRESPTATVVDVLFDEDVNTGFSGLFPAWGTSGAANVISATVMDNKFVRLTLDAPLIQGETVDITTGLPDIAGNIQNTPANLVVTPQF